MTTTWLPGDRVCSAIPIIDGKLELFYGEIIDTYDNDDFEVLFYYLTDSVRLPKMSICRARLPKFFDYKENF
jgi:hypothetical protein